MGQVPRQPFSAAPADDRAEVTAWRPARVPGDVRADLIAAGRIPPVDTPAGIAAGAWVDECDWWYRAQVDGECAANEVAILEADGIDYYSAIWLDGHLLTTHAGMFARQTASLSPWVNAADPHELAIRVWGGGALPRQPNPPSRRLLRWLITRLSPGAEYFPDRMMTPKAQFSFGWDFAPRLLTAGIWDDLRIVTARHAYIEDLWVQAEPLTATDDPTPALLRLHLRVTRWQPGTVQAEITVQPENFADAGYQSLSRSVQLCSDEAVPCTDDHEFALDVAVARRWWPWDQGDSCLYRITVRLMDAQGVLDEITGMAGVRSVAREPLPDGSPWRFVINGRPLFLRGANWVPADVLPGRVTEADYRRLLGQARDAGINFLRVWGGGVREKQAFWDFCDRLGIMGWQEFPLACAFFDHYPRDRACLDALAAEARGTVWALRSHPSLIAWCGGNEINPVRERLPLGVITDVLRREDPDRLWLPASPADGDLHQWDIWHGRAPWASLADLRPPFMSEFGMQALPGAATVAEMFANGAPESLADPRWPARKAQVTKLRHYAGPGASRDLPAAIAATQRAQAVALQVGIEACRLRRAGPPLTRVGPPLTPPTRPPLTPPTRGRIGGKLPPLQGGSRGVCGEPPPLQGGSRGVCGGVAFWQFNEPWPAVTWSVIDHAGRPKAAYEMLRRSYQPILIAARFRWLRYRASDTFRAEFWLVNDSPRAWDECRAEVSLDGQPIWPADGLRLAPGSSAKIGDLTLTLSAPPTALDLRLTCGDDTVAVNRYDLAVHLPGRQPLLPRLNRWLADRLLRAS